LIHLETESCFLPRPAWTMILLFCASHHQQDNWCTPPCTACFLLDGVFFWPNMVWNPETPDHTFLSSLGWQVFKIIAMVKLDMSGWWAITFTDFSTIITLNHFSSVSRSFDLASY
jgi:hypothetical protein